MAVGLDKIVIELQSSSAETRNAAAIRMIDGKINEALPALLRAILEPRNLNMNGTLVYALGHFENSAHFDALVAVALKHGFEASMEAQGILAEADFDVTGLQLAEAEELVRSLVGTLLPDHQQEALELIQTRFFGGRT